MTEPVRLLFICTGNSCRSQMAEGYARALGGKAVAVVSAGIEAHGLNPRAVAAMAQDDVDISGHESTLLSDAMLDAADVVVTVCGHADGHCPLVPPGVQKQHWPLPDPARAEGSDEEVMKQFRAVRDEIRQRVTALLDALD